MATAFLLYYATMTVAGVVLTVASVGKPRKPVTGAQGALTTLFGMVHMAGFFYLSTQL